MTADALCVEEVSHEALVEARLSSLSVDAASNTADSDFRVAADEVPSVASRRCAWITALNFPANVVSSRLAAGAGAGERSRLNRMPSFASYPLQRSWRRCLSNGASDGASRESWVAGVWDARMAPVAYRDWVSRRSSGKSGDALLIAEENNRGLYT